MKKLIVLSGSSNSGKTETLNFLVSKFGGFSIPGKDGRYICKKNNLTIAICTAGDYEQIINDNISFFDSNFSCDVFISAARSKGSTVVNLSNWAKSKNIEYNYITKSWIYNGKNNFSPFNDKFADFLNSLI